MHSRLSPCYNNPCVRKISAQADDSIFYYTSFIEESAVNPGRLFFLFSYRSFSGSFLCVYPASHTAVEYTTAWVKGIKRGAPPPVYEHIKKHPSDTIITISEGCFSLPSICSSAILGLILIGICGNRHIWNSGYTGYWQRAASYLFKIAFIYLFLSLCLSLCPS